ncbi:class III extradiol ring-cleavage dioxygenase [Candidatus Accumulibacter sp. ACC003]|uniref:dioxygenase family protein n=1 Tax=Candidatus Accumulibacter sp. ACC003 TaxID=2823334 RepID=UPI0025BA0799|nr:class III extradiol ring-cleavage dioxygenase [Candidatus Accumulibacter sp. ACC003]
MHRLPSVFVSHGAPTFAIEPGLAGPQLTTLGRELAKPRAVLIVSPHWMTPRPQVGMVERPRTIHDFGGFDPALYEIDYPVHGHPQLARRTLDLLQKNGWSPRPDERRGLDHGAWVPMLYLYPEVDVPVFQVSLPSRLDADSAWSFGQALAPLADDGVLIVGSGSLTHNLYDVRGGHGHEEAYAAEFAAWVRDAVTTGDSTRLRQTLALAPHAERAHPSAEHFWPLLVAAGAAASSLPATVIEGGITHGVLAMDCFIFGSGGREGRADDSTLTGSMLLQPSINS